MQFSYPFVAVGFSALLSLSIPESALAQAISPNSRPNEADEALLSADHTAPESAQPMATLQAAERWVAELQTPSSTPDEAVSGASDEPSDEAVDEAAIASGEEVAEGTPSETVPPEGAAPAEGDGVMIENVPVLETEPLPGDDAPVLETDPSLEDVVPEITQPPDVEILEADPGVIAPEYLNPEGNPLSFPTQPEEVEILGTQPITLEQAIELAFRNNHELRIAILELARSQAALEEARAERLPTLDLGSGLTVRENQENSVNNQLSQVFPGLGEQDQDEADITLQGTVQLNYDLYTSGRRSALIRAAEARVRLQELQVEVVSEQLRLEVTSDYYDLQEADEQVRIATASLEEALQSLQDAQALERAGVGTRFDVLQSEVDVANFQQELTQALSDQLTARRQLARQLSVAHRLDIAAADPVEPAELWELSLEESIVLAFRNRAELEQQVLQREISEEQRRAELAQTRPQISLFAQYDVSDTMNSDQEVEGIYSFGAQLNWRLFDGGVSRARANQAEAEILIAEEQFADTRNEVRFQVEQAYLALQANRENIDTARLAVEQATEALRLARLRFQAGVGTQTDVLRSQTELTRAEVNLLRAILGYNRSLVTLKRAISNFPDNNLNDIPFDNQ